MQQPGSGFRWACMSSLYGKIFFLACSPSRSLLQPKGTSLAAPTNDTDDREHRTDQRTEHLDSEVELRHRHREPKL